MKLDLTGQRFGRWTVIEPSTNSHWLCKCDCGVIKPVLRGSLRSHESQSCGCLHKDRMANNRTGEKNPHWKGGVRFDNGGYKRILVSKDHPRADRDGYVLEHLVVMESKLGRPIDRSEVVHHKDGNNLNNSINNLVLLPSNSYHITLHRKLKRRSTRGPLRELNENSSIE